MFTGLFIDAFVVSPYIDFAETNLVWNIGAGPSTLYSPNILSELTFEDMKSRGIGFNISHLNKLNEKIAFYIEADLNKSSIKSGDVQDSDYNGDDRTGEFSRSYAEAGGDGLDRKEVALGFKYRWFNNKGHYFSVLVGQDSTEYDVEITNGVQYIPADYRGMYLNGLRSSYDSKFTSSFIALISEHVFSWGTIGFRYEKHDTDFDAKANWNLREGFAHPVSFAHTGEGTGKVITLGYTYTLNPKWDLFINWTQRKYEISDGYDHTFFSDGSAVVLRLNQAEYESDVNQAGFRYFF